jgi:DNA polymerase-1
MDEAFRIHPSVNVVGTVTGRFAYSDPNLQTIPRDGTISGIKACFGTQPGKILVSYDLKSAELRFMASLAGESGLIEALAEERDIYQEVADRIGVTRQIGKSLVLSWPYGVGPIKFSRASGLSVKDSRNVIAGFEREYVNLSSTMSKLSLYAEFHGRLPLLSPGRFRRFTGPHLAYPVPGYTALNAACQGGVADTMGDVMIQSEAATEALGAELVLQVHDSLVYEAVPGTENALLKVLTAVLDEVNPLSMPLVFKMAHGL